MMKFNCTFVASALSALMLAACSTGPKVVEMTLDVSKVELTDTATVLHVDAYFRPHYWIRIDAKTYLRAGGEKYALTSAQGITPDSLFWMPESGEASFVLSFQPLPKRTKSFDFIESDCADCFKLFGIDLTGKKSYDTPEGIPAEALQKAEKRRLRSICFIIGKNWERNRICMSTRWPEDKKNIPLPSTPKPERLLLSSSNMVRLRLFSRWQVRHCLRPASTSRCI